MDSLSIKATRTYRIFTNNTQKKLLHSHMGRNNDKINKFGPLYCPLKKLKGEMINGL